MTDEQYTGSGSPAVDNLMNKVHGEEVPHVPDQPSRFQELPGQVAEALRHLVNTEEAWVVAVMLGGVLTGQREVAALLSVLPVGAAAAFRLEEVTDPNNPLPAAEASKEMWQQSRTHVLKSVVLGAAAAYSQTLAAGAGQLAQEAAQLGWEQVAANKELLLQQLEPAAKGIMYLVGGMAGMRVVQPFQRLRQAGGAIKEAGQNLNEKRHQAGMQWGRVREFFSGTVFAAVSEAEGPRNKFAGLIRDFGYWMDQLANKIEQRNETSSN